MHANQIVEARKLATPTVLNITAVDEGPYMVVQYVPDLGTGGAAATVTVATAATTITFQVDAAAPANADAIGNSTGEIITTQSTYDTMGELVDYINGRQAWRAYLVGALRADTPTHLLNFSAASCFGATGKVMYGDNSDSLDVSLAISGERFVNNGINGHVKDWDDQCENSLEYGAFTVTCASPAVLRYYSGRQGSTETQLMDDILLTTTVMKEQGEANPSLPWIQAERGERLVIRVVGLSPASPATVPTIHVIGTTAVLSGSRIVTSYVS